MPFAACGDQTLRATARDSAYYCGIPLLDFPIWAVVEFPLIGGNSAAVLPAPRLPAQVPIPRVRIDCQPYIRCSL